MRLSRTSERARLVVPVLAAGYAVATVVVLPGPGGPITTYATSIAAATLLLAAGIGLIAAGAAAWLDRPTGLAGPLALAVGAAWLAPVWVGWADGAALLRSLGAVAAPFLLPALAHLVLGNPSGRIAGRAARLTVAAGWAVAASASVGLALFRNPLHDVRCWSNCSGNNVFLLSSNLPVARALSGSWLWFSVAFGVVVVGWAGWRLVAATPPRRAMTWQVLVPAAVAVAGEAGYATALIYYAGALRTEPAEPSYPLLMAIFLARGAAFVALAVGLGAAAVRERRRRTAVARLADELGAAPPPGALRSALAASLGDQSLEVGYWLPTAGRWVDAAGQPLPAPGPERASTEIHRDRQPVAVVRHEPTLAESSELAAQIGAAARLAIDNERLRAEALARLEEVRASRARIVTAGDDARRRLERDLHDGAQQRLLAVSYELRLAQASADARQAEVLDRALEEARTALAELRELAHGIFPAILDEAGLGPALRTLADTAAVPVELNSIPEGRLPVEVERTAYLVVAGAVEAARTDGGRLRVNLARDPDRLVVDVTGARDQPYLHLADRVGALGGTLNTKAGQLRAEVPCG